MLAQTSQVATVSCNTNCGILDIVSPGAPPVGREKNKYNGRYNKEKILVNLILENCDAKTNRIKLLLENTLGQINDEDLKGLDSIYILHKSNISKVFKGFNLRYDPMYIRRGKNGKPCITISYEEIYKKRRNKIVQMIIDITRPLFWIMVLPVLIIWDIKDRNMKFRYIGKETTIDNKYLNINISRSERRIVAIVLYFIGVHQIFGKYINDGLYTNINIFEFAVKYRTKTLEGFKWLYDYD